MDGGQQEYQRNGSYEFSTLTNPPTRYFGSTATDVSPTVATFDFYEGQPDGQDQDGGHDENDPKRRRIARVRIIMTGLLESEIDGDGRPVICAERRRSNAMGRCQHAHIAQITRRNVYLLNWRKSATLRKGNTAHNACTFCTANIEKRQIHRGT